MKSNGVKTGAVNCDREQELCRNIRSVQTGRPAIRLVYGSEHIPYDGATMPDKLSLKDVYEFVTEKTPLEGVTNLRLSTQADEFTSKNCADKRKTTLGIGLILFTAKFETSLMIKSVAHALRGKVVVGEARGANDNLAREFGLGNDFPILIAVCAGQEKLANEGILD